MGEGMGQCVRVCVRVEVSVCMCLRVSVHVRVCVCVSVQAVLSVPVLHPEAFLTLDEKMD